MHLYELLAYLALICICVCCCACHGMVLPCSGTLFRGLNYSTVSQTLMATSMEREYRVR